MASKTPVYAGRIVPDGTYTIVGSDGRNCTIEIEDAPWACEANGRFAPKPVGTRSAALLIGPNNSRDFMKFAFILPSGELRPMKAAQDRPMRALQALLSAKDPSEFGFAYAMASGNCFRCGRKLTVEASLHRGLGPECAKIVGEWFDAKRNNLADLPVIPAQGAMPATTPVHAPAMQRCDEFHLDGTLLTCRLKWGCRGFDEKKATLKRLGFTWDGASKMWSYRIDPVKVASIIPVLIADLRSFESWADVAAHVVAMDLESESNMEASKSFKSSFTPTGLKDGMSLYEFQAAGIEYAVKQKSVLIADEMGLGKTVQSILSAVHLGCSRILAIVPNSQKLNWRKEVNMWTTGSRVLVIGQQVPTQGMLAWATVVIINYEQLDLSKNAWLLNVPWDAIVCDEAHYLKNPKAQRTANVLSIVRAARDLGSLEFTALLTGTPVLNRPIELYSLLEILDREDAVGGFWPFVMKYCGAHKEEVVRKTGKGKAVKKTVWNMDGAQNLVELHDRLRASGMFLRRLKADVLKDLPPRQWSSVPLAMSGAGEATYLAAEHDAIQWMYSQDSRLEQLVIEARREFVKRYPTSIEQTAVGGLLVFAAQYIAERRQKAADNVQLTRLAGLRSAIWEAKRDAAFEWMDGFLAGSDHKLIVFAHHRKTVDEVADRYRAPKIQGEMTVEQIEAGKHQFQTDPACRVIVCNLAAGGVGHTLTAASDVAFLELPWTPALLRQAIDRAHRIGQLNAVTGWMLVAERSDGQPTFDGMMVDTLVSKAEVVDAVTDGQVGEGDLAAVANVTGSLLALAA